MQEQVFNKRPLVDVLSEQLGKRVVMSGDNYVYLDTKEPVAIERIEAAIEELENERVEWEAENEIETRKTVGLIYPLNGVDYLVPFKSTDAIAMMQVKNAFEVGVASTNIKFSNDTIVPMKSTEFQDFAVWFATQRNSFFA